ncbi:MAG: PadR family transcriptional regulator [Clostridiales bacterium]|nr:PadR family transcriptional regulator [Clostridiales bacterium]
MRNLKYAILGILSRQPMTGYDMAKEFDRDMVQFWHAKTSQLYPELSRLTKEGLITFETSIKGECLERKLYSVTDEGMNELRSWLRKDEELPPTPKDTFRLRMFFCDNIDRAEVLELVESNLKRHQEKLSVLQHTWDAKTKDPDYGGQYGPQMSDKMLLHGAIMREENTIQWLEDCLEILREE